MKKDSDTLKDLAWLITGGCGFIGTNLVATLIKENYTSKIRVLDNLSVGKREDLKRICNFKEGLSESIENGISDVEFLEADIMDYNACLRACEGIDVVVHLAANTGVGPSVENPWNDMQANVIGTFNMLEASRKRKVKKYIFASSGAPLGDVEPPIHEEKAPRPVSPYGASKLAGEAYCSAYYGSYGLKTVSLRFGNVYGPRSKHKSSVVAKFIKNAIEGYPLEVYGDGKQTRDFVYVEDLIQAIILSVKKDIGGEVFQIATYKETTVDTIADKIKNMIDNKLKKKVAVIYGKERVGDVRRNYSDISKAVKILGFRPKFKLAIGLEHTFDYFISNQQEEYKTGGLS